MSDGLHSVLRALRARRDAVQTPALGALLGLAVMAAWLWRGPPLAVVLLAAAALALAIGAFWKSLRELLAEGRLEPEDAYSLAVTVAEDEQKLAVLRALDDLAFERYVGKIAPDEARREGNRYRQQALALLDAGSTEATWRSQAEQLLAEHLSVRQDEAPPAEEQLLARLPRDGAERGASARRAPDAAAEPSAGRRACRRCQTLNDPDASFCKSCGKQLATRRARASKATAGRKERSP